MNTVRKDKPAKEPELQLVKAEEQEHEESIRIAGRSPYQCVCTLVKTGKLVECRVHRFASFLPEARH
ncbi:MAG TPA: hypothetical protein V6C86_09930 [Oculatellaceae cyanobacterium]